nr:hypothetical protein [uncultured Campylobacter sp.]
MRSIFSGEICAAADKFKFAFERSFEILFSYVLLGDVKFPSNSAVKILNGKIPPSKILRNEALLRGILLGRIPLLVALSRKISHPWIYERKIPARKIPFFEILQTPAFEISQALFCRASTAPRSIRALNFASQNPLTAPAIVASENSCAVRAVKFIKFTGSASSSETALSLALTAAANRTQAASFTAANFAATKAVKEKPIAIKAIIVKFANALNLASSCVFARLKSGSDLKEASRAH